MIKGIIFDLDGTTLNTLFDIQAAINDTLKEFNFPPRTYDEVRIAVGRGSKVMIKESLPDGASDELIDKVLKRYLQIYSENYDILTTPYEGMSDLLKTLQEKGIVMCVNTNKPDDIARPLIKSKFPNIEFMDILGQVDYIQRKPDPAGANLQVSKMGFSKEEVLYIGDSETDYATAKNAKLKFIGCSYGFRGRAFLEAQGVENIIDEPVELLNYLK